MTTSKPQERDNIGTASKEERERENKNTFLCAARTAAARLAEKAICRTLELQVKGLAIYRLS
jgi:hypothetical protein